MELKQETSRKEMKEVMGYREHPRCYTEELTLCSAGGRLAMFAGLHV